MPLHTDNLNAIFFDFDDVLADSLKIKADAFLSLFDQCSPAHRAAIEQHFYRYTGHSRQEKLAYIYKHILKEPLPNEQLNKLCDQFKQRSLNAVITSPEIDGASALLKAIPNDILCFVVSGTPEVELKEILAKRTIEKYFSQARGTPTRKEINIAELVSAYELDPARCLMIGDGIVDKEAADYNDMPFFGIVARHKTSPFPDDTKIFSDLNEVAAKLGLRSK